MRSSSFLNSELYTSGSHMLAAIDGSKLKLDLGHDLFLAAKLEVDVGEKDAQQTVSLGLGGTLGSWIKAPPLLLGGSSPVVAYLRHSMMVVLPDPLYPTMRVSGVLNWMASLTEGLKDRTPEIDSLSILDMMGDHYLISRPRRMYFQFALSYRSRNSAVGEY